MRELPNNFNYLRKIGENESYLSEMIRNDSVDDQIAYVNRIYTSLNSKIYPSIYETNLFLIKNPDGITLIEYSMYIFQINSNFQIFEK